MPKIILNVKENILNSTREMLREKGYNSLNIRDIAVKCAIGMGTIYNYYASKEDIIKEVIAIDWARVLKKIDIINNASESVSGKLRQIFECLRNFVGTYHGIWVSMYMDSKEKADYASIYENKSNIKEQFERKIRVVLNGIHPENPMEENFISEFVANVFIMYSLDQDLNYDNLEKIMLKILK